MPRLKQPGVARRAAAKQAEPKAHPTRKYHRGLARQAYELTLLGLDDKALARVLDASERSLNTWRKTHPEFAEACRRGREQADAKVAAALYQRAIGMTVTTQKAVNCGKFGVKVVEVTETVPPDTKALELWLKHHPRSTWNQKNEAPPPEPGPSPRELIIEKLLQISVRAAAPEPTPAEPAGLDCEDITPAAPPPPQRIPQHPDPRAALGNVIRMVTINK